MSAYRKLDRLTRSYLNAKSSFTKEILGKLIEQEKLKKLQNLKDPKQMAVIISGEPNSKKVIEICRAIYTNVYSDANVAAEARQAYDLAVSLGFSDLVALSLLKLRSLVASEVYKKDITDARKAQLLAYLPVSQEIAAAAQS